MNRLTVGFLLLASLAFEYANAECANACNGHGKCTSYDMCICNRNWQANDCSERVCMFGLAHVDTPKGDLDASGTVTNANKIVTDNSFVYPYGTTEQFPLMQDSDLQQIPNSAHYYMECSNKGRCDRKTGECQCFEGYDGVACQRASCPGYPNSCSGHGVCKTIRQLAKADYGNVYELWDRDATMGCECDPGYFGPDCSERKCKYGVDPLYLDDAATVKYSIFDVAILSTATANDATTGTPFTNGANQKENGYFALRFFDMHGEDWLTDRISAGATCSEITAALYGIPNNVVPLNSIECTRLAFTNGIENVQTVADSSDTKHPYTITYKMALWEAKTSALYGEVGPTTATTIYTSSTETSVTALSGYIYRLKFYGNPGKFRQPAVELYLDGKLPTLISPGSKVITKVWTDGQQGENLDYFADHCNGVTVTIGQQAIPSSTWTYSYLTGFTLAEKNLLKKCLGSADFDEGNNVDVYNWDYGNKLYPHIIKLVRTVTTANDGGYYAALWYDTNNLWDNTGSGGTFRLLNPFVPPDNLLTDNYDVYTTKGTLALTSNFSEATFGFGSQYIYTTNTTFDRWNNNAAVVYDGDISCEVKANNGAKFEYISHCLNHSDIFTLLNFEYPQYNPPHINLYTAKRIMQLPFAHSVADRFTLSVAGSADTSREMHFLTHQITADLSTNWGVSVGGADPDLSTAGAPTFHVYKFFPKQESTYEYVAQCSNRGICDTSSGICKCFPGYTNDDCSEQSSLAL